MNSHDDLLQIFWPRKEVPSFYLELLIISRKTASLSAGIRSAELHDNGAWSESITSEALRVEHHPQLTRLTADDSGFRNVIGLLQRMREFSRDAP